jgi:hypothetical protein
MSSTDKNNKNKYISKPKISRKKSYATEESDIIRNEQKIINQKEERNRIRQHNIKIASGNIHDITSSNEIVNNKKRNKCTEKKALDKNISNGIVINHCSINDSDIDNNSDYDN